MIPACQEGPLAMPAARRLMALAPLDADAAQALHAEIARSRSVARGGNVVDEGAAIPQPLIITQGWAGRLRLFQDGRMQILGFLLPGDLIGNCSHKSPASASTVTALTDMRYCRAPSTDRSACLREAYAVSRALDEAYLLAQIARLGRLSAEERLGDLLLELLERLDLCGLVEGNCFGFPLTQTMLADATGLTVVHVNRMIRQLRDQDDLSWSGGVLELRDADDLSRRLGRSLTRVVAPD